MISLEMAPTSVLTCGPYVSRKGGECHHTTVEYGPCMSDKDFGCEYKTRLKDCIVSNKGTKQEQVFINRYSNERYQEDDFDDKSMLRSQGIEIFHIPRKSIQR